MFCFFVYYSDLVMFDGTNILIRLAETFRVIQTTLVLIISVSTFDISSFRKGLNVINQSTMLSGSFIWMTLLVGTSWVNK